MRALLFVAFLSLGCDATEPTPYVPTYDPTSTEAIASTEFCALLARNTCAVLRPCCTSLPFAFDETKCQRASRAQCEARRQKSLEIGLQYDDIQAGRCVRGTAIMLPECRTPTNDPAAADVAEACRMVFHGSRKVGDSCRSENPLDCAPPALGVRVYCTGTCRVREILGPGDDCSVSSSTRRCGTGLICEGQPPRCSSRYLPLGAECSPAAPESDRCDVTQNRYCSVLATPSSCTEMPSLGDSCSALPGCARPYRCDTDRDGQQRCTDAKVLGQACADNGECASRLCAGQLVKVCMPSGIAEPIASVSPTTDPAGYVARIAAACSGIIPDGAGGLAPFELPPEKTP